MKNIGTEFKDLYYGASTEFMEYIEDIFLHNYNYDNIEANHRDFIQRKDALSDELKAIYLRDYFIKQLSLI